MVWFWCQLWNNYSSPVRVVVISNLGQGTYYINPGQFQWVQWYPGMKVLVAFDQFSGAIVTTYTFSVTGPTSHSVISGTLNPVPGTTPSMPAPVFAGPGAHT